jgi:hypothetical protein
MPAWRTLGLPLESSEVSDERITAPAQATRSPQPPAAAYVAKLDRSKVWEAMPHLCALKSCGPPEGHWDMDWLAVWSAVGTSRVYPRMGDTSCIALNRTIMCAPFPKPISLPCASSPVLWAVCCGCATCAFPLPHLCACLPV